MTLLFLALVACTEPCDRKGGEACVGEDGADDTAPEPDPWPVAVPLAGCSWLHTAAVTVGEQTFHVSVDSGSATMAVAAKGCLDCRVDGDGELYDTDHGVDEGYTASSRYNTGNIGWEGEVYGDTVGMAGVPPVFMDFGAISDEDYIVNTITCDTPEETLVDGILGLRQDATLIDGTDSFLSTVVAEDDAPDGFALHLCHTGGTLWIGGYDPDATTGPMAFVPGASDTSYSVVVDSFEVQRQDGTTTVAAVPQIRGAAEALLDSGGPNLLIPPNVYDTIVAAILADPASAVLGDAAWWDTYDGVELDLSPTELDALLPRLLVDLDGDPPVQLSLPASESYLDWSQESSGTYRYSRGMSSYESFLDLGNIPMTSYVVYADRESGQIGFAPAAACP